MSKLFGWLNEKHANNAPEPTTPVIAISAEKGGVGKTTTAVNIASCMVKSWGMRVLIVDVDPQGHVMEALKAIVHGTPDRPLSDVLVTRHADFRDTVVKTRVNGLYLTPADRSLRQTESVLAGRIGKEFMLGKAIRPVRGDFDCIILDSPPNLGNLTLNALVAATQVLVPVDMSHLATTALKNMMQTLEILNDSLGKSPGLLGVLRTKLDKRRVRVNQTIDQELAEGFGDYLFQTLIPESTSVTRSQMKGLPLNLFDPHSTAAMAYETLTSEILKRLQNES